MSIESDSQGELYQYFLGEAPELLQIIEETLLSLIEEKTVEKVHTLMRSAHTLKGSAASVEQGTIQTIAHHLEDVFEALYPEELAIDTELGALLLEGYDCLREPLSATLSDIPYDENTILEHTAEVFAQLQEKLGDFFGREAELPTSEELGFDVVGSIFAESVVQDLELLEEVIVSQNLEEIEEVLRSQTEFFADLGASYELPGLTEIAETTITAIEQNPDHVLEIAVEALANFHQARADILDGDRQKGGEVSAELQNWVTATSINPEAEMFDDSFFFEPIDDGSEMTMAFAVDSNALTTISKTVAQEFSSEVDTETFVEETEPEAAIIEEVATLESKVTDIQLNATQSLPAKSPVDEILQSIAVLSIPVVDSDGQDASDITSSTSQKTSNAILPSIKVAIEQLDQLNHTVGELFIKENQQNLQQEQLQLFVKETFQEFRRCQQELSRLGDWSEQQKRDYKRQQRKLRHHQSVAAKETVPSLTATPRNTLNFSSLIRQKKHNSVTEFDALEMEVYSDLDLRLQTVTEKMTQLGNKIEAIDRILQQSYLHVSKRKQLLDRAQKELLQARMLPLNTVLNRFPRHLQQMVASHQKPAKLKTIGGEVSIDKAIAEKLYEPLLHLIRNAYDHGLETPEVRLQQGKSEAGKITIRAYNRGNRTIIEIKDDGKGIDLEKVLIKAIEKNFLEPSQLDSISNSEIIDFLFQPGFSTASEVTDLSGRGVGLNVVKSQITSLDGTISVRSNLGEGTTFTLQLPLNLTTARLLLCESQGIIYGILSTEIERIIASSPEQLQPQPSITGDSNKFLWREQQGGITKLIPICPIEDLVDYPYPIIARKSSLLETLVAKKDKNPNKSLLLIEAEDKKLCLQVDRILIEQELVIKSLNSLVILPSYIQGYSVLGDGNLSLVINPVELVAQTHSQSSRKSSETATPSFELSQSSLTEIAIASNTKAISFRKPTILVVEDSIVQRQSLVMILEKGSYEIIQAANGQEAIAALEQNSEINLIISDVEMPVINGFELLSYCQNDAQFSQIPIAMVTTRSGQKHRQLALSLGAKGYLTKPAKEKELLYLVSELISL
ncbi:CheA signal transduction histidine kinase [Hyella patelloides LEGE 07179]|uniref:histidine kinase n=1 Tax=Hyella patelloides LEGE 07179 TaxID=945734 RepID=A0A563VQZ6_9CYAN|nr:hybrid sensor histidine kinase/response regulator [Hyella patelloides]VEP13882.1 CheA signal transduction histidine kinase [Hyella patelloides LEGE 07179]